MIVMNYHALLIAILALYVSNLVTLRYFFAETINHKFVNFFLLFLLVLGTTISRISSPKYWFNRTILMIYDVIRCKDMLFLVIQMCN